MATTSKTKKEKYIRQRPDGRWEARIKVGEKADGSPDIPSRYFNTRTEARAYVRAILDARARGEIRRRSGITLGEWCDQCLELYGHTIQDYSYTTYKSKISTHIKPSPIARLYLEDISIDDLQTWINNIRVTDRTKSGKSRIPSPKTVADLRGVMSWLLNRAFRAKKIISVPDTSLLELPRRRRPVRKIMSPDKAAALLAAAQNSPDYAAYVIDAVTGIRRSELLGLCWDCIDLQAGTYKIRRKVTIDRNTGRPKLTDELKTESAERCGNLVPEVIAILRAHRRMLNTSRLSAGAMWREHDLLFPDALGYPRHPDAFSSALSRLQHKAGIVPPVGINGFRHLLATRLIHDNVDDPTIAAVMGHRSADFTRSQYADVYDSGKKTAAEVGGNLLRELSLK